MTWEGRAADKEQVSPGDSWGSGRFRTSGQCCRTPLISTPLAELLSTNRGPSLVDTEGTTSLTPGLTTSCNPVKAQGRETQQQEGQAVGAEHQSVGYGNTAVHTFSKSKSRISPFLLYRHLDLCKVSKGKPLEGCTSNTAGPSKNQGWNCPSVKDSTRLVM